MISIVIACRNRRRQLIRTLHTINVSSVKHVEVIVVDDASLEQERVDDLPQMFPFLRVTRVDPENRWWSCPCVPYNMAIKQAQGDIIIIQNAECMHAGDILDFTLETLKANDYFSFGVYSIDKLLTTEFEHLDFNTPNLYNAVRGVISPMNMAGAWNDGVTAWYNHSQHRQTYFHFISAIHASHLMEMRGFDERFAHGVAFDDDDLVLRLRRKGLNMQIVDQPFGVHQWHFEYGRPADFYAKFAVNKNLFDNTVTHESGWEAKH